MKIPGAERAIVDVEKVRDYLLSSTHPIGKFKAAFFAALGYTARDWMELRNDLLKLAASDVAVRGRFTRYGNKYEVSATLTGPSRRSAAIVAVWIVKHGDTVPRFVTAYPGETS